MSAPNNLPPYRKCSTCGQIYEATDTLKWCREIIEGQPCKGDVLPEQTEPKPYYCAICQDTGKVHIHGSTEPRTCPRACHRKSTEGK